MRGHGGDTGGAGSRDSKGGADVGGGDTPNRHGPMSPFVPRRLTQGGQGSPHLPTASAAAGGAQRKQPGERGGLGGVSRKRKENRTPCTSSRAWHRGEGVP